MKTTIFSFFFFFLCFFLTNAFNIDVPLLAAKGTWTVLHSSIGISAMHMQVLHSDTVVMFDRTDFGPSNLSLPSHSSCRHDPNDTVMKTDCTAHSLVYDLKTNEIRPLRVQTDTWCSSGAVLPNGTLFQSGGYNDGDRVVRLYSPCQGCDWVEHPGYLSVRRWYATNQILPDGNVIIVGGRREFSYELFVKETKTSLFGFDFLRETSDGSDENNLYPFVHLLPDGTLFVFANTRGVVLDYARSRVVRTVPPIPGEEPRNYPSTGSSVALPIRLPQDGSDRVEIEVLVCGGAPRGARRKALSGVFVPAVRTCGRLTVTDPKAEWWMETMPMGRVMGDMVMLPTGDVLIINGAGNGTAGWELGRDPVTRPVLYKTYSPSSKRFQLLHRSNIPRMYHSAAVLDSYGRVLVGGSNPHVYYNFTGVLYPTELSLEAFNPPYLDQRFYTYRPRIVEVAPQAMVLYGQPMWVRFTVPEYLPEKGVQVVLIAPSFTTHSLGMNQRMMVLAVDMVVSMGSSFFHVNARAPPSARIAPPGYYMLFVVHAGVPSTAVWLRIRA